MAIAILPVWFVVESGGDLPPTPLLLVAAAAVLPLLSIGGLLAGFARATARYRTVRSGNIALRFPPGFADPEDMQQQAEVWENELKALTDQLSVNPTLRVLVYVLPEMAGLSRVFYQRMAGAAFAPGDLVVLAADALRLPGRSQSTVRHEFTHILSSRWGKLAPALKAEGLATWLAGSVHGKPVDLQALATILGGSYVPLWRLIDDKTFHSAPIQFANYALAGSFTGFLLKRHGPETYRGFFRDASARNLLEAFEEAFGDTLAATEREWREGLLARADEFDEQLTVAVTEVRLAALLQNWQLLPCLREAEAAMEAGQATGRILWTAAECHTWLGHYEEAAKLLERALDDDDFAEGFWAVSGWLALGRAYDCLGRRAEATEAYEQTLSAPDHWDPDSGSVHDKARRYLRTPFSERMLVEEWHQPTYPSTGRR